MLQGLADEAADLGITLGLEAVNRYETNVINTAASTMSLLADVNRDNVVVHLDTYHMNIEEFSMESAVRTCGDKLGCVAGRVLSSAAHSGHSLAFPAENCTPEPAFVGSGQAAGMSIDAGHAVLPIPAVKPLNACTAPLCEGTSFEPFFAPCCLSWLGRSGSTIRVFVALIQRWYLRDRTKIGPMHIRSVSPDRSSTCQKLHRYCR